MTPRTTSIELFTGGGGLALAMHAAGFEHLLVNEAQRQACETIRQAGWPLVEGDVPRGDQMRQLGNAVPVLLGRVMAEAVGAALSSVGGSTRPGTGCDSEHTRVRRPHGVAAPGVYPM